MRFLVLLFTIGLLSGYANEVNVAFVIGQQHKEADEFTSSNGWHLTRYQDTDLGKLAGSFDQYQIVIWGSLAGYEKKLPWQNYHQALRKFIEDGGIFIVLDGNYDSATQEIFGSWGTDFQLKRNSHCTVSRKEKEFSPKINRKLKVNHLPYGLAELFDGYPDGWSHFESLSRSWRILAYCPDGNAFMITRQLGKGTLAILAYAMFNPHDRQIMLEALASNLLADRNQRQQAVNISAFHISDCYGKGSTRIGLSGETMATTAEILLNGKVIAEQELKPGINEISFEVHELGKLRLILKKHGVLIASKHVDIVPPVSLSSTRYVVYPLIANQVLLNVPAATKELLQAPYRIAFFVDGKKFTAVTPLGNEHWQADFSQLAPGEHEIKVQLMQQGNSRPIFTAPAIKIKILAKNPRVAVSPKGNLQIAGKPFFPLGLYHVSKDHRLPLEKRDETLQFAAENGYNMLHVSIKPDESEASFQGFLQKAKQYNIMILPESDHLTQSVHRYANDPAILGWNIGDEPDLEGISPAVFLQRMQALKMIDAEHPSYTVFMNPASIVKYWPVTELVAVDPYPIPRFPLNTVYKSVVSARDVLKGTSSGLIAVLQGFGYENDPTFTLPSNRQVRNMLYQALVAGAKGIIFYTYQDGRFYLPDHPDLCKLLKSIPAELKGLEDFLLNAEYCELPTNLADVYAAEWKKPDSTLTIIVNTTAKAVHVRINGHFISLDPEAVEIRK